MVPPDNRKNPENHADRPGGIRAVLGLPRKHQGKTAYHKMYERYEDYIPHMASEPCDAWPGSIERILTYQKRIANGECLWHPQDRK